MRPLQHHDDSDGHCNRRRGPYWSEPDAILTNRSEDTEGGAMTAAHVSNIGSLLHREHDREMNDTRITGRERLAHGRGKYWGF